MPGKQPGVPGKPGRPPNRDKMILDTLESLVDSPQLFERDMRDFFREGKPRRLQRWLIAAGDPRKAELIASHMTLWLREKIASLLPEEDHRG